VQAWKAILEERAASPEQQPLLAASQKEPWAQAIAHSLNKEGAASTAGSGPQRVRLA
jgi:hypothetical protein